MNIKQLELPKLVVEHARRLSNPGCQEPSKVNFILIDLKEALAAPGDTYCAFLLLFRIVSCYQCADTQHDDAHSLLARFTKSTRRNRTSRMCHNTQNQLGESCQSGTHSNQICHENG